MLVWPTASLYRVAHWNTTSLVGSDFPTHRRSLRVAGCNQPTLSTNWDPKVLTVHTATCDGWRWAQPRALSWLRASQSVSNFHLLSEKQISRTSIFNVFCWLGRGSNHQPPMHMPGECSIATLPGHGREPYCREGRSKRMLNFRCSLVNVIFSFHLLWSFPHYSFCEKNMRLP